ISESKPSWSTYYNRYRLTVILEELFSWRKPAYNLIKMCWEDVKKLKLPSTFRSENDDLHPTIRRVFNTIGYKLKAIYSTILRPTIPNPKAVPDLAVTIPNLSSLRWADPILVMEMKTPQSKEIKQAQGEAWSYLNKAIRARQGSKWQWKTNPHVYGVACDFKQITFFVAPYDEQLDLHNMVKVKTATHELFPTNWMELDEPTIGFQFLCHRLNIPNLAPLSVLVNDKVAYAKSIMVDDGSFIVCTCSVEGKDVVVKKAVEKRSKGLIDFEHQRYQQLWAFSNLHDYMVPIIEHLRVDYGMAMERATPIIDLLSDKFDLFPHFQHLLHGLKQLHQVGFVHGDIRPANIVVHNKRSRFIDWVTLSKVEAGAVRLLQGHDDYFWPSDPQQYKAPSRWKSWDLVTFGLSMMFMAMSESDRHLFQAHRGEIVVAESFQPGSRFGQCRLGDTVDIKVMIQRHFRSLSDKYICPLLGEKKCSETSREAVEYCGRSLYGKKNEEVVNYALKQRPNVKLVPTGLDFGKFWEGRVCELLRQTFPPHPSTLLPHTCNMDGFYVGKFKKISNKIPSGVSGEEIS
ncbi:rRNA (cytosine-C5-)-methyltransferase nop2, partial [Chytridiales sp. JEL 0842]